MCRICILMMIAFTGLSLTSCNDGDDLNTDQYGNDIALNSFGPSPVLRGGMLYFYGSNLDQIREIDLPGADPITSINVITSGAHSQIAIQVPAEKCDTGIVTLVTAKGGIIKTLTPVTYREDIVFDKFYVGTEGNLVGNVGDVVTIKGDYLNLLHGVIFADKDTVREDQFLAHDRYTIQVAIPAEAKTGKFVLTDLAETPTEIESEEALTINLPTVSGLTPENPKAGQTITVKGESLTQIASVKLVGATVEALTAQTDAAISFVLPAAATDGEVTLVTKSGVEIPAGSIVTVVPTSLSAAPAPVKNGADLTITGKDLDLVTSVTFPNADAVTPKALTATQLVATVPTKAQEGDITLILANGKTVTVAYTLVKPAVTGCTPASLTAGDKVIIRGTNLDLVASITFPGEVAQTVTTFAAQSATAIGLVVPAAASGTGFTLNLKNGSTVAVPTGLDIKAATDPSIAAINPASATAGTTITITGKNFNNVQNVYIGEYKVTKYTSRSATEIVCQVPATAADGTYTIFLEDYEGKRFEGGTFTVMPKEIDLAGFAVYEDRSGLVSWPFNFSWSDSKGKMRIMKADLVKAGVKLGSKLIIYKNAGARGQVQINNANWGGVYTVADWGGTQTVVTQVFDDAMMAAVTSVSDGWSDTAFILQGDLSGVTKMTILP